MKKEQIDLYVILLLGTVNIVFLVLAFLALTDIYNGESDTTVEWSLVRLFFLSTVCFLFFGLKHVISRLRSINNETLP